MGGGLRRSAGAGREFTRRKRRRDEDDVYDERVLGSSAFVSSILREAQGEEEREVRRRVLRGVGVEELARKVAELGGVRIDELRSGGRRRLVAEACRALAQVAVEELGRTGSAVARYPGVSTSTANRGMGR